MMLFEYTYLQNAVLAAVLAGISCAIIGSYVVTRRLVFLSGGITHCSFGGIGIAYYLGLNPLLGALTFSVAAAIGIDSLSPKMKIREDSAIGVIWALGMALGIIFISLTPGYAPNLMSYMFGSILTITTDILIFNIVNTLILISAVIIFNRQIIYTAFDPLYSSTQGVPVKLINGIMMFLVASTIVLTIKLVGIVLLVSLITIPTITANLITNSYNRITLYASIFSIVGCVGGLYVSYLTDLPSGASIVILLVVLRVVVGIIKKLKSAALK